MRLQAWVKTASAGLSLTTLSSSFVSPCSSFGVHSYRIGHLRVPSNLPTTLRWQQDMTVMAASGSNDDDGQLPQNNDTGAGSPPPPTIFAATASNDDDAFPPSAPPEALMEKELKRLRKKAAKEARREKREGKGLSLKPCNLCGRDRDLLIRCQIDTSLNWFMVCGKCWKDVSGGVADGDAAHPHYRYGGLWKAR